MGVQILQGDCREMLQTLPDESVNCCVTSPPYFGLRDYGTATWEGGDPECDHGVRTWAGPKNTQGGQNGHAAKSDRLSRKECRCGARRIDQQIGLEQRPEEYVEALVAVFRDVRRVLRRDGTLWLNLGDSYASRWPCNRRNVIGNGSLANGKREARPERMGWGLKDKDLMLIPHRVAIALQEDGWWVRSDIVWAKGNPMPESVRDRPTKAHEYIFLLAKAEDYYYDKDAVLEPFADERCGRDGSKKPSERNRGGRADGFTKPNGIDPSANGGRNRRSVWQVNTRPYKGAHFATFPPALVEPCILAGCPPGGVVLDPFAGSGTVGEVAAKHGRDAILIELSPEYVKLIEQRVGLFVET